MSPDDRIRPAPTGIAVRVVSPGALATVQDRGRAGYAHLGVPRSGAADSETAELANRLAGNDSRAALIEATTLAEPPAPSGLVLEFDRPTLVGIAGRGGGFATVAHGRLVVPALGGLRTYVAPRGGIDVRPVLGSRSTDVLSGLGPAPLSAGDVVTLGRASGIWPAADVAPRPVRRVLTASLGPRADWFADPEAVFAEWEVSPDSNRVGVRLLGRALVTAGPELPSEGMPAGAIQVPPSGQPVLFLADHPTTGGYPVIAVLDAVSIARAAQLRPGERVRLTRGTSGDRP
ncbi:5-oxoprolinase subunit C family protein [Tsukamurella soli]|uniref:Biotin-dependent carboxyltransferase family protein n=1 Tax=Tsukamurella soli TaxID=644556 RepID=A0ABP8KGH0_9ACTN